jgi:hypothetical protein
MTIFVTNINHETDEQPANPANAQLIGYAAGVRWYKAEVIPAEGRKPTPLEWEKGMLVLPAIRSVKQNTRRRIEYEVGDLHEIIADQARQIEALTALGVRIASDYLGGTPMDSNTKATYLARVESIIGALDSGALVLRGEGEDADDMLAKVMDRTDRINRIIKDDYLPRRDEFLNE